MISKRAITGLDVTVLIACGSRSRMVTTLELAESTGLSVSNLEQILKQLKNNQIIKSVKGPGGGYQLSADIEELTVLDLVRIFDKSSSYAREQAAASTATTTTTKDNALNTNGNSVTNEHDPSLLAIDTMLIENSFVSLIEEFLGSQKLIDLVSLLPQWNNAQSSSVTTGRFKLKDPPPRIIPRSPNSVFQLSAFMASPAYG